MSELSDAERIERIRQGHERYKRRQKASATGVFEANASDTSRAGFDVRVASEILSPGEWSDELNLDHVEMDEGGCE